MNDSRLNLQSLHLSAPTGANKKLTGYTEHLIESVQKREVQIGKTKYIVKSSYIGKETFSEKIKRLVLNAWENEQYLDK
ncbi:hypothetical protein SK3146_05750 [Paenibacillus konkukensis]|uniref:Uncharacterized protein n=1 Tax=Paenibacillus konkukensis TaxID=2020716 RepID=A0ABY4RVX9_9BACL|nr:transposon-encoded TnpW family protein [Paenibacillus konkukensis]UQZ86457.1 hypothetical protein SK3146_05750 [Paenibacillus konkukensis]